jgi:hypothetical protein
MLRCPTGSVSRTSDRTDNCWVLRRVSTRGASPVTVIVSSMAPGGRSTFTVAVNPAVSATPSRRTLPNPASEYVISYVPGRKSTMLYRPWASVTTVRVRSISAGLVASTVTPGSTPPDVSRTTPAILLGTCAHAGAEINSSQPTDTRIRARRITPPRPKGRTYRRRLSAWRILRLADAGCQAALIRKSRSSGHPSRPWTRAQSTSRPPLCTRQRKSGRRARMRRRGGS